MFAWGWDWPWGWGFWPIFWVFLVLFIVPWIFFLINLRGVLERINPANRAVPPEYVWLNLIPVFNLGWFIYTVYKVTESLKAEYARHNWAPDGDFGFNAGLAAGILGILSFFFGWVPLLGWAVTIAALACWIVYWIKTASVRHQLGMDQGPGGPWYEPGPRPPYSGYGPRYGPPYGPPGHYPPGESRGWSGGYTPSPPPQTGQPGPAPPGPAPQAPPPTEGAPGEYPTEGESPEAHEKRCAMCGTSVSPDDRFCRGCGLQLPR